MCKKTEKLAKEQYTDAKSTSSSKRDVLSEYSITYLGLNIFRV